MNLVFTAGVLVPQQFLGHDYFRGAREAFPGAVFPGVPVTSSLEVRAAALAEKIDAAFPTGPIHIVAHSMGGLDTRCLLSRNLRGLAAPGRVASLSTISSPHRGSPIADLFVSSQPDGHGVRPFAYALVRHAFEELHLSVDALGELTTGSTATFNANHPDVPHVRYRSYAGDRADSFVLKPAHLYIETVGQTDDERANDGIVSLASASWGEFIPPRWPADHFSELGYNLNSATLHASFDHIAAYKEVVRRATT